MYDLKVHFSSHAIKRGKERAVPKKLMTKSNVRRRLIAARSNNGIKVTADGGQIVHIGSKFFAVCMSELWGGVSVVTFLGPEEMKRKLRKGENYNDKY